MANGLSIVGIGGTLRPGSTGAKALQICLDHAKARGAETVAFTGADLEAPLYDPAAETLPEAMQTMVEALRKADGIILASPGYHGGISGALKNALDYTQAMVDDDRVYFDGRAVGCIATAGGWQAAAATLSGLRNIVHALRGWPTPLGVMLNSSEPLFDQNGECVNGQTRESLCMMTDQIIAFAERCR